MKTTDNYGFKKPESTDFYNVDDFNDNMDILDEKLKELEENSGSGDDCASKAIYGDNHVSLGRKLGTTVGNSSFAFGYDVEASGARSHAEGGKTTASGLNSHAEGYCTKASGEYSHAEGDNTTASGTRSHAEGYYTIARSYNQHVQGRYNVADASQKYAHIVGGGTSDSKRKNIHTLDWDGNAEFAGDVTGHDVDGNTVTLSGCAKKSIYGDDAISLGRDNNSTVGNNSAVVGGYLNVASEHASFVGGGTSNIVTGQYSAITGGQGNDVIAEESFIGGGNDNKTNGRDSVIIGGVGNEIDNNGSDSVIMGGRGNYSNSPSMAVCGNYNNPVYGDLFEVGNGNSDTDRKNVFRVDAFGNGEFSGDVKAKNILKTLWIEFQVTTNQYDGAMCGYSGITNIANLLPSDATIVGVIFNKCLQDGDGNRVGVASTFHTFENVVVNAGNVATYNVAATLLYLDN